METVSSNLVSSDPSEAEIPIPRDDCRVTKNSNASSASLGTRHPPLVTAVFAVAAKDFRSEFRTRYSLNAVLLFAVTAIVVIAMSVPTPELSADGRAALLWTIVFFAAMSGLHRAFVREEETKTADALRLSVPAVAVYFGKWLFNLGLLAALEVVITTLFIVLMHADVERPLLYAASFLLGDIGLVTVCTIMAAIVARARTQSALFAVICFPLLVPMLKAAVAVTGISLGATNVTILAPSIQLLVSYAGMMLTIALMTFEFVWKES